MKALKQNKAKYRPNESDPIFERITKAYISRAYEDLLEYDPIEDKFVIPTSKTQKTIELNEQQKNSLKEMELLKRLNEK